MTPTDGQIRIAIAEQAAEWFIANQANALSETTRLAFMTWLRTSPVHVEEYLGMATIARDLRAAGPDPQVSLEALLAQARLEGSDRATSPDSASPLRRRLWQSAWTPVVAVSAAALAAVVVGLVVLSAGGRDLLGLSRAYATAHGEHRSLRLADGSSVQLNTESGIRVRFGSTERLVEVTRGQAFFQVAHDARRRFRVSAGGADLIALGTQFDVEMRGKAMVVTVVEGQVVVFSGHARSGAAAAIGGLTIRAMEQVRLESGVVSAQPAVVDLHQVEAWLRDQIVFEQRELGEIADEFNRYAPIPIEIRDASLRALVVSGVFDTHDTASFVAFLQTIDGVTVVKTPTRIYVLKRSPAGRESIPKP
jgi:transmembrane sensor